MKLIRHSIYNLLGLGLPLIAAIFTIPVLVEGLGDSKFGLLTLIWALVSYFSLFDLGLGRVLTQQLALILDGPNHEETGPNIVTSLVIMFFLGLLAGSIILTFGPMILAYIKSVPDYDDAVNSINIMAISMPFIILTSGFRGILEAKHKFAIVNAIRLPMGLLTFIGPVLVLTYYGPNLVYITAILVLGRVLACILHGWFAWISIRRGHGKFSFSSGLIRPLCLNGGWMTVSNIVSPLMGYIDRFIIGLTISAAAVAFYTTPQEIITKLIIIPGALTAVLFPTFASQLANGNTKTLILFKFSIQQIFLILLPLSLFFLFFSEEFLTLWINKNFSINSQIYLKVFAIGVLVNCVTHVPFTLIQSAGYADITAKIHLIQLPIYLTLLWVLISSFGILGAALGWLARMIFDSALIFFACYKIMRWNFGELLNIRNVVYLLLFLILILIGFYENYLLKIFILILLTMLSLYQIYIKNLNYKISQC